MINISALLDEIKASPYREIVISTPHTGMVTFSGIKQGDKVVGPQGQWKEKPGTLIATLERERNPKAISAHEKGEISLLHSELEGTFVEAGTPLAVVRHLLTRAEVERILLQKALHLFVAPERAKYYFTPEVDKKIRAADSQSVAVREMRIVRRNDVLVAQADLSNLGRSDRTVFYRFQWLDNIGSQIGDGESWKQLGVLGLGQQTVKSVAPSAAATDFRLEMNVEAR